MNSSMKVMFIQYSGEFYDTYKRIFIHGENESYYGQEYSVGYVIKLSEGGYRVLQMTLMGSGCDNIINDNLRAISLEKGINDIPRVKDIIEDFHPDRIIISTPNIKILRYLRKKSYLTFPVFADSFDDKSFIHIKWHYYLFMLKKELLRINSGWIANHQLNASLSITKFGIDKNKILPFDWQHNEKPVDWEYNISQNIETKIIKLFYAGMIIKEKGIYDLLDAIKIVEKYNRKVHLTIVGKSEGGKLDEYLSENNLHDYIDYLGILEHRKVLSLMNKADLVVVPSQHQYPEGLPMTIMEALLVHTPVILSDHPMFIGRVGNKGGVAFFEERKPNKLAEAIIDMCSNQKKYLDKVYETSDEWINLNLDLKWADMISLWLQDPYTKKLEEFSLKNTL